MKQTNEWKSWCVSYLFVWFINVSLSPLSSKEKIKMNVSSGIHVQMPIFSQNPY
jgi:hypothetical protein